MKIDYKKAHFTKKESRYFEDFIISVLEKQGAVIERESVINSRIALKKAVFRADAFLKKGYPGITFDETLLEIKYAKSVDDIVNYINNFLNMKIGCHLVVITLINDKDLAVFSKYDNVYVLGSSYVSNLVNKYPSEWWIFVASCSDVNKIYYDPSDKAIHISNPPLASQEIGKEISLIADNETFKNISFIAETDFKKRIKHYKKPALFLGNGISAHFGSDNWETLSDSLFDYLKPEYVDDKNGVKKAIGATNYSSTSMSKYLIDSKKYYESIYYSLYRKYSKTMHINGTLLRSVSTIKRANKDMPIITYNYDNFLEMDYEHAFSSKLFSVASRRQDLIIAEPKVIHVHGLMPYKNASRHSKIILTQEEYYSTYKAKNWAVARQKELLSKNTCLFVGSSMSDLFQMSVINDVRKKYYSFEEAYSWKCFALLCLKDMNPKDVVAIYNYYFSKGVHIIVVNDFDELSSKIMDLFGLQ